MKIPRFWEGSVKKTELTITINPPKHSFEEMLFVLPKIQAKQLQELSQELKKVREENNNSPESTVYEQELGSRYRKIKAKAGQRLTLNEQERQVLNTLSISEQEELLRLYESTKNPGNIRMAELDGVMLNRCSDLENKAQTLYNNHKQGFSNHIKGIQKKVVDLV